jgi:phosphotransacetylase
MQHIYGKLKPGTKPLTVAVVHPTDVNSLMGAFEAAVAGYIVPILVGPEAKIKKAAADAGVDISAFDIVPTPHSHAAAEKAVELVRAGKAEALMKGKLSTEEFSIPIVHKEGGLRTGRRMSHVFIMQDPDYHKPLYITDAALNIAPDLKMKKDIIQNAIDLFESIEGKSPKVAVIAASEKVEESMESTLHAAALAVMSIRGQIQGGKVEGPFALDNAISKKSANLKGIFTDVAGDADILMFPDLVSGNAFFKSRSFMSHAPSGGVVLGARVPIILTSRSAEAPERKASAALALLAARSPAPQR